MTHEEVLIDARRQVAAYLRDCPSEGELWEGPAGSGQGSYQPDDAGRRAADQFRRALDTIADELVCRADAEAGALKARADRRTAREHRAREARQGWEPA